MPTHELMQGERDFVGMRCAPGNNALELDGIVRNGADFHQHGSVQDLLLSVAVNHSPMNALCRSTGKQNPSGMRKETSQNCLALADGRSAKPKVNSLNGAVAAGRRVSGNFLSKLAKLG